MTNDVDAKAMIAAAQAAAPVPAAMTGRLLEIPGFPVTPTPAVPPQVPMSLPPSHQIAFPESGPTLGQMNYQPAPKVIPMSKSPSLIDGLRLDAWGNQIK